MDVRTRYTLIRELVFLGFVLVSVPGCTSTNNPAGGTPVDPVAPLALTCPGDVRVTDVKAPTETVGFSVPSHAGGVEPVSVTCSPGSGTSFALGSAPVVCSGKDAATPARAAACSFTVTLVPFVPPVPTISLTKFMAYGDSITKGEINADDSGARCPANGGTLARTHAVLPNLAYPAVVESLLSARYTAQTFTVFNQGQGGDPTINTGRFAGAVRADRPQAVLFLQGAIDLADSRSPAAIASNIAANIADARAQGVSAFFLSTILPVVPYSRGCFYTNAEVRAANDAIRALATQANVYLVDAWAVFVGHEQDYLLGDGLHPTVLGQQALAKAFFDVIQAKLESSASSSVPAQAGPFIAPRRGR